MITQKSRKNQKLQK